MIHLKYVKIHLSKYSEKGNAFIEHIKEKHTPFYEWFCKNFDGIDDNNLAKNLVQTALNTLKEGEGEISIKKSYTDDSDIVHDIHAFQIQVPLKDAKNDTEHRNVILRFQKNLHNKLVLVTAFEKGNTD